MRTYEVAFIASPAISTEELEAYIGQMETVIEGKGGKMVKVDNWGKKSLAYKIKKFRDGYYVILTLEADGAAIAELERRFRVTDFIIRFLSVRTDEDLKRSTKLKAGRQRKAASKARPLPSEPVPQSEPDKESEETPEPESSVTPPPAG